MAFDYEILLRLLVAVIIGGLIGFERSGSKHEAGLRTHILVCLGAATIMALSEVMTKEYGIPGEMLRMGAQVVSGIGFLGAGSIISTGNKIKGITTAAGVWTTACVGLVIGAGYYIMAVTLLAIMLFVMIVLKPITRKMEGKGTNHTINVYVSDEKKISQVIVSLSDNGIEISKIKYDNEENLIKAELHIVLDSDLKINDVVSIVSDCEGIKEFNVIK